MRRPAGAPALALVVALVLTWSGPAAMQEIAPTLSLADAQVLPTYPMRELEHLESGNDPMFGTSVTRVTSPGALSGTDITCSPAYCTHRYSSSQAWNADGSLLMVVNGCNGACFLDGQTYKPLFRRDVPNECEWHPTDPSLMICMNGQALYLWTPVTGAMSIVYVAEAHQTLRFGPYKGNPSVDGSRVVVRATDAAGADVAFAYDIAMRHKFPDIALSQLPGTTNSCSISPTGKYIHCTQSLAGDVDQAFVFSVEGTQVQRWAEHHRPGHGDMTIDVDGEDVYVGISKSDPDQYHVVKRRLRDGAVTDLAPFGEGQHVSLRNIRQPGWAYVSYGGRFSDVARHPAWAPFYQEVIALRIDGSREVRRIAQTRNPPNDYWSETHASPSPDGTQVIWSSNWGRPGDFVSDFVTRVDWPATISTGTAARPRTSLHTR